MRSKKNPLKNIPAQNFNSFPGSVQILSHGPNPAKHLLQVFEQPSWDRCGPSSSPSSSPFRSAWVRRSIWKNMQLTTGSTELFAPTSIILLACHPLYMEFWDSRSSYELLNHSPAEKYLDWLTLPPPMDVLSSQRA